MPIYQLTEDIQFPHPKYTSPYGILAVGGDLSPERLLLAYQHGIFPWYNPGEPIYWWSPDPRFVLYPDQLRVSKSMRPYFNQQKYSVSFDRDFRAVMSACQQSRLGETWITNEMLEAYCALHELGYAHSVEVWDGTALVGGLYGVSLGKVFFGESMFARASNASKFGFISLVQRLRQEGFQLIDCQQETGHLASLGAYAIPRPVFLDLLAQHGDTDTLRGDWGELLR